VRGILLTEVEEGEDDLESSRQESGAKHVLDQVRHLRSKCDMVHVSYFGTLVTLILLSQEPSAKHVLNQVRHLCVVDSRSRSSKEAVSDHQVHQVPDMCLMHSSKHRPDFEHQVLPCSRDCSSRVVHVQAELLRLHNLWGMWCITNATGLQPVSSSMATTRKRTFR
jgi:hypothetical protein